MFGSGFGSLASSSAFGAPAQPAPAFGAPAFGATQTGSSAFGGGFGQPAAATPTLGGGGLFGTPQPQQQQQSVFGQPQQATGTGMFGAAASQPSVFGQPSVSAFGAASPAVGGLGALQPQQQQQPQQPNPQLGYPTNGQGSRVVPFQPETIKQADQTQQFRHISSMSQYADKSAEELRFEDYVSNCKGQPGSQPYPSVHPNKVGTSTGVISSFQQQQRRTSDTMSAGSVFGGNATTSGFGSTQTGFGQGFGGNNSAFGASSSAFGNPASQSLFGSPASTPSLFGQQASQPASIFGTPAANTGFGGGGGAFGQSQPAFGFGQQQQQQQPALGGGAFGAASSSSLFGQTQQQNTAFGAKPATGLFGQAPQSSSLFGNPASATSTFGVASSASIFGQAASQPAFGGGLKPATGFGTPSPSPFGNTAQQPATGSIFGGQPAASSSSLFGGASSSSLFGQSSASPFGAAPAASGGGLFGQQQAGGFKPPGGTSLFGSGSSLFGGAAGQSSSSLFGNAAPAGGSLFGGASSSSLFGGTSSPSMFGNAASQPQGTSLFGGGSLFGQAGAQQAAVAPVSPAVPGRAPYGALPTVPKVPEMRSGIAASAVSRSVAVPPPVLFRPKPRMPTPVRASSAISTPPSTDTQLLRRSPSIFKISYRDPGLVIHTPLPSTNASTSAPATSESIPTSPAFVSPSVRGSPNLTAAITPEIQPANGMHAATAPPSAATPPPMQNDPTSMRFSPPADQAGTFAPLGSASLKLPKLPDGWWVKPSMEQLAASVERNPGALASVDRFTIGQSGIGSIMFLEDVDLTGIDSLEQVFCFEPGSVSAYYDGCKMPKPAPGGGVNRPARVQIELTGKQMKQIISREDSRSQEEYLSQLKLRLKSLSAGIDANFIDLEVKGARRAVWIFEVKHWSRYGLPQEYCDDDDDSDDDMDPLPWPESRQENQGRANMPPQPPQSQPAQDAIPKRTSVAGPSGMAAPADSYQLESEDVTSVDMQESQMQLDVPMMGAIPASPLRSALMPLQSVRDRIPTSVTHLSPPLSAERALAVPPSAHTPLGHSSSPEGAMWRQPRRPLQIVRQAGSADDSPLAATAVAWDGGPRPLQRPLLRRDASFGSTASDSALVDIAAVMSSTKRACVSLQGHVAHVSHTRSAAQVHSTVSIHRLQPGALLVDDLRSASKVVTSAVCDALRQRAEKLLDVHSQHSAPVLGDGMLSHMITETDIATNDEDMDGAAPGEPHTGSSRSVPLLQFRCTADAMPCRDFQDVCTSFSATSGVKDRATGLQDATQALGHTLGLAQRLFCALEPADGTQGPPGDSSSVQALLSSQRKRELSAWLEDHVESEVAESIHEVTSSGDNLQAAIVELLSANDVHGAAAVAVQCGLPRLATVVCSGGLSGATRSFLHRQIDAPNGLPSWQAFRFFDNAKPLMPPEIAAVYKLLAGDLSAALVLLASRKLSWQRLFGMCLWFGCGPEQPIRAALHSFNTVQQDAHAASDGMPSPHVPLPLPAHLVRARTRCSLDSFTADVQFVLLQVASKEMLRDGNTEVPLLRQLVSTSAYSADVLDSLGAWLLLCILLAVGEAPTVQGQPDCLEQVFAQLTLDCAATLLWLGLPTWTVYVLTHLQAASPESLAAKEALIQHVLNVTSAERTPRHAPFLQRGWLQSKCALPVRQLARADALYALTTGDNSARGKALLDAEQDSDMAAFAQTIAGPQHFSWKNSAVFGSWLVDCPAKDHPDVELIYAFLRLKQKLEGRVVQGRQPECVNGDEERSDALQLLRSVCGRIGQMHGSCRNSFDQKTMFVHMASVLGGWLLAGSPGSISAARLGDSKEGLYMPSNTLVLHNIVLGAECKA